MHHGFRYSFATFLIIVSIAFGACSKKKEDEETSPSLDIPEYPVYPEVNLDCSHVSDAVSADPNASGKPGALVIPFKISKSMNSYIGDRHASWPTSMGPPMCTPLDMKEKINKILQMFGSDPNYNVRFVYMGTFDTAKYRSQIPKDGTLYINLTHGALSDPTPDSDLIMGNTGGPLDNWGTPNSRSNSTGSWPASYPGGLVTIGPMSYDYVTMIHEIGHAAGLFHAPPGTTIMNNGFGVQHADVNAEYLAYGEQDRVNLAATRPVAGYVPMKISGQVTSSPAIIPPDGYGGVDRIYVYAVDVVSGRTYFASAYETNGNNTGIWKFTVEVGAAGTYKVFATTSFLNSAQSATSWTASWSTGTTSSTKNPASASSFTLSTGSPTVSGLSIPMIYEATPFYLNVLGQRPENMTPSTAHPAFLLPNDSMGVTLVMSPVVSNMNNSPVVSLETFGSSPDVTISGFQKDTELPNTYYFNVNVGGSAPSGPRLVVARAASGNAVYGLIGIEVLPAGASKPTPIPLFLQNQMNGEFDFTTLNPTYRN